MVQKFNTLLDAIELAKFAHRKQVDKAGLPYVDHPLRVLEKVKAQGALPYVQMAAVLHDCTEDSRFTPDMLLELGIPEGAVEIVKLVDRHYSEKVYNGHAERYQWEFGTQWKYTKDEFYYYHIKKNPGALMVKLADIEDNLANWRLSYLPDDTIARLREKYRKAQVMLGVLPASHFTIKD